MANLRCSLLIASALVLNGVASFSSSQAVAQSRDDDVAAFYRGRTISMVIGYSAGGGYDVFARLLMQHLGRHIPGNPTIVAQNMPGAGSRVAANYLYDVAAKDGTVIGTIGRNEPIAPLIEEGVRFDGTKFGWIGSITDDNSICLSWHTSPIRTWQDMKKGPFTAGALAPGDNTVTIPLALKNLLGANIRVVSGYPGTSDLLLALERGEVEGVCGVSWRPLLTQRKDWIAQKKVNVLVEVALRKDPTLGDVPLVTDFITDDDDRKVLSLLIATQAMARPFLVPPGIPAARKEALRSAFDATMNDPQFLSAVEKASLYVNAMSGRDIDALLGELYASPKELAHKAAKAIQK